jgi:hypothetical protein
MRIMRENEDNERTCCGRGENNEDNERMRIMSGMGIMRGMMIMMGMRI